LIAALPGWIARNAFMKLTSKLLTGSQDVSAMAGAVKVLEMAFRVEI